MGLDLSNYKAYGLCFLLILPLLNEEENSISYGCSKEKKMAEGWSSQSKCQIRVSLKLG